MASNSAKRTKLDSTLELQASVPYELSTANMELLASVVDKAVGSTWSDSSSDSHYLQALAAEAANLNSSSARGKYRCGHCGVFKVCCLFSKSVDFHCSMYQTEHVCPYIAESVFMRTQCTSIDPVMVVVVGDTLIIAGYCIKRVFLFIEFCSVEKTIGVRKWKG